MRALILAPLLAGACSLSLDVSLIPSTDAGATGGATADASFDGSSGWGATAGDASASGGSDAASGGSAGAGGSGGAAGTDAAADGSAPSPSPGLVDCDTVSCDPANSVCCQDGGAFACRDLTAGCTAGAIACDSTEDCGSGQVCCLSDIPDVACQTTCQTTQNGVVQFCKTDSECGTGTSCLPATVSTVPASYRTCQ